MNLVAGDEYIIFQGKLAPQRDRTRMINMTANHNWRGIDAGRVRAVSLRSADVVAVAFLCAQAKRTPVATICDTRPGSPPRGNR